MRIRSLLFEGVGPRFTQDSPILPEVWTAFALKPEDRHALLLTPLAGTRYPKSNLVTLRRELSEAFGSRGAACAWVDESIFVTATWDELIQLLLPRTAWYQSLIARCFAAQVLREPHLTADAARKRRELDPESLKSWQWLQHLVAVVQLGREATLREVTLKRLLTRPTRVVFENRELRHHVEESASILPRQVPTAAAIYSIALNRRTEQALVRSRLTVKADAAERVFGVKCAAITWAVLDSGIDARHRGFRLRDAQGKKFREFSEVAVADSMPVNRTRIVATYDFSLFTKLFQAVATGNFGALPTRLQTVGQTPGLVSILRSCLQQGSDIPWSEFAPLLEMAHDSTYEAPVDAHGTHVAGILGADLDAGEVSHPDAQEPLRGLCPDIRILDLRVFGSDGDGDEFSMIAAMQFVRYLNRSSDRQRVHGVNLSLSLRHNVANYACGSTPICRECDRLVGSGVIVVAAAGNLGYSKGHRDWTQEAYRPISITDPGNAECAITVGSTHRDSPHTYGVSYFSSRGPTGDGRSKPDLVAPGEKILSLAPDDRVGLQEGTSMAAPHVSGVAAMLLARYPELAGQPARVKDLLCSTAMDLRRERNFQGAGLVDALKALQTV